LQILGLLQILHPAGTLLEADIVATTLAEKTTMAEKTSADRNVTPTADRTLLIVEDDKSFLQRLARAMEGRGFTVMTAESVAEGLIQLETSSPAFAVVDMRLGDGNGLDVISALKRRRPDARAIILTGYGNIATAVTAVNALLALEGKSAEPPENPMSADRVRWEHIQRIYELCNRNVSETARRLNMHRRTLQRILAKRAPK
jgi:two-component system response regulator RegA